MRDSVSVDRHSERFDDAGVLSDPETPAAAAKVLLDQLTWWARALREARAARPYPEGPTRPPNGSPGTAAFERVAPVRWPPTYRPEPST